MSGTIDYSAASWLTDLSEVSAAVLEPVPADPVGICRLVPGLVLHPRRIADLYSLPELRVPAELIH